MAPCLFFFRQDWDFPDFSDGEGVKVVGADFTSIRIYLPSCLVNCLSKCSPTCAGLVGFYISAKWFNYFGEREALEGGSPLRVSAPSLVPRVLSQVQPPRFCHVAYSFTLSLLLLRLVARPRTTAPRRAQAS